MVQGVQEPFTKRLEVVGVGYQASLAGNDLSLQVGFANTVKLPIPEGVSCEVPAATSIVVKSVDKQKCGQFAANIRRRPTARALQGQGNSLSGRVHSPQVGQGVCQRRVESFISIEVAGWARLHDLHATDRSVRRTSSIRTTAGRRDVMKLGKRIAKQRVRRAHRVRNRVRSAGRPRMSVFRSNKHIYAQIIDDADRSNAGCGQYGGAGAGRDRQGERQHRVGRARSARRLPSVRRRRASPRSVSIAAYTSIMVAWPHWPMRPARADSNF